MNRFLVNAAWYAASITSLGLVMPAVSTAQTPSQTSPEVLKVCTDPDNLPFSNEKGSTRGLFVDVAEMIGKKIGRTVEYNWWLSYNQRKALRLTILDKSCDVYFALPADPEYKTRGLDRTQAFIDVTYALVSKPDFVLNGLSDLKGKRIAVLHTSPPHILLSRNEGYTTSSFLEHSEALAALSKGEVDAALLWGPVAGFENLTSQNKKWRVTSVTGEGFSGAMAVAVRKDVSAALLAPINKALSELAPEISKLADQYGFPRNKPVLLAKNPQPSFAKATHAAPNPTSQGRIVLVANDGADTQANKPAPVKKPAVVKKSNTDAGATPPTVKTVSPAKPVETEQMRLGRVRFNDACSHCHGADGISFVAERDLRRQRMRYKDEWQATTKATIKAGRPDAGMPSWKDTLNDAQIDEVLSFLSTVQK